MATPYLDKLNDQQRAAAVFGTQGSALPPPLLVIAGAGSGKTAMLAHRVAHLLVTGADPRRILLMTFSRRATSELTRRVERITAAAMGTPVAAEALCWSGTFHAIGARILREHALAIGLHPDFSIHDREDSADLINLVRNDLGLSTSETRFPTKSTCLAIYSRAVNSGAPLSDVLRDHFPWCAMWADRLRTLFGAYVIAKQTQNVLDYDDLLLAWAQVMADPGFAAHIGGAWDHVLIDEYQDTNRLQARILTALKPDGYGLTVVGDDAQSIYAFRAADGAQGMARFVGDTTVAVPLGLIALNWLRLYKPLMAAGLPQTPTNWCTESLGFMKDGWHGITDMAATDLRVGTQVTGVRAAALHAALDDAAATIARMPAIYMTYPGSHTPIFPIARARVDALSVLGLRLIRSTKRADGIPRLGYLNPNVVQGSLQAC